MKKKNALIVGMGQLGKSMFELLKRKYNLFQHDINTKSVRDYTKNLKREIEVKTSPEEAGGCPMHICFPFNDDFVESVKKYYEDYKPEVMIIHSSVKPGTTKDLADLKLPVVHSPSIFDDNDFSSICSFRKMIGYDNPDDGLTASNHLRNCCGVALVPHSKNTEVADVMLGLYAMTCRAFTFELSEMFERFGCEYDVMREILTYNNFGYGELRKFDHLLQNRYPNLNKADYRLSLNELIPEEYDHWFFKLARKSFGLEKESVQRKKEEKEHGGSDKNE